LADLPVFHHADYRMLINMRMYDIKQTGIKLEIKNGREEVVLYLSLFMKELQLYLLITLLNTE
jgi:hypothetical protein